MITSQDIATLKKYVDSPPPWPEIPQTDRDVYAKIHEELGQAAKTVLSSMPIGFESGLTAGFNPKSGIRGVNRPKDLWCAIFNATSTAYQFNPQIFCIASGRGIEVGLSVATHPSDFSTQALKKTLKEILPALFRQFPEKDSAISKDLTSKILSSGGWHFRKKVRLTPQPWNDTSEDDFKNLDQLIDFIKSDSGLKWGSAAIVRYCQPDSNTGAYDLTKALSEAAEVFTDVLIGCRPQPMSRVFIEKTHVAGITDRLEGPHSLGKALWSPQTSKSGANIYKSMLYVSAGDVVIHLIDNTGISGVSLSEGAATDNFVGLPNTEWAGQKAFRIPLKEYIPLKNTLQRDHFLAGSRFEPAIKKIYDDQNGHGLFFNKALELNQGAYLTEASPDLVRVLDAASLAQNGEHLPHIPPQLYGTDLAIPGEGDSNQEEKNIMVPFSIDDALEGLFLEKNEFEKILTLLKVRQNLILQGPPGVGKTFISKRLAYALIGAKSPNQVQMVQFHQSYSYEDFVQGYRPTDNGFSLRDGVFTRFCDRARNAPDKLFVFIIDEINRGNLSKVLGELMLLIEPDKRGPEWAVELAYHKPGSEKFYIPENVYILGMMNTADRSLAVVDYALRRRFVFIDLKPQFESDKFTSTLRTAGANDELIGKIVGAMTQLNNAIASDTTNLGPGFQIGHSFFCGNGQALDTGWYRTVIETEIAPLLAEYYFDDPAQAAAKTAQLLG